MDGSSPALGGTTEGPTKGETPCGPWAAASCSIAAASRAGDSATGLGTLSTFPAIFEGELGSTFKSLFEFDLRTAEVTLLNNPVDERRIVPIRARMRLGGVVRPELWVAGGVGGGVVVGELDMASGDQ